ncbi:aminotransferase class IV [Candidatus Saccharibacteria bacterium]|nr:aminotransferase class IV [Candidatus Saccharibacteria bacterium]
MKIEKISIDGIIKDADEATLPATNQGLMSGLGVFETFRVCDGKVFLLDEHFARLQKSLRAIGISQVDETQAIENIFDIAKFAQPGQDAFIRFFVTTEGGELANFNHSQQPKIVIYMSSIPVLEPRAISAKILSGIVRNKPEYFDQIGFRIKSLDYLHAIIAQKQLSDEAGIMLTHDGYIAEALTANIFWSKDGKIYTPPLSLGILPGIMRQFLIENLEVAEKNAQKNEILDADEIFLSSSVNFITPLDKINSIKKPGLEGPVSQSLSTKFSKLI